MMTTKTELHTHLIGMLSAKGLLEMIKSYTEYIYWPLDKPIDSNSQLVSVSTLLEDEKILEQLSIPLGERADYEKLDNFYISRTAIINFLISISFLNEGKKPADVVDLLVDNIRNGNIPKIKEFNYEHLEMDYFMRLMEKAKIEKQSNRELASKCQENVFNGYINRSLEELIANDIKYVEISYSYERIISMIKINSDILNKIKCKFLLSTNRDRNIKQLRESVRDLKKGLLNGLTVGFDIMGTENALTDKEKEYDTSKNSRSFKRKLEIIVDTLISNDENNTLRIHSGETPCSFENTMWILDALTQIKNEYKFKESSLVLFPPPEIRIGHALYFEKSDEYIEKLRELNAIIEINASSNYALKNIKSYGEIPYDYYLTNGIPVVISTDGHGLYDTNVKIENMIASSVSEQYDLIPAIDNVILEEKLKK